MQWECNFTLNHYFEVLDYAKKNKYAIGPLHDFQKLKENERFIILRHDVDVSLEYALRMATLEAERGLHATYFVLLHSQFYNALSGSGMTIIKKISELGHEIGLHYDTDLMAIIRPDSMDALKEEVILLSDSIGAKVISIAQHNPTITHSLTSTSTEFFDARGEEVSRHAEYISDSVRNWRRGCMCNHVGNIDRLQILTHPIWWVKGAESRSAALDMLEEDEKQRVSNEVQGFRQIVMDYIKEVNASK